MRLEREIRTHTVDRRDEFRRRRKIDGEYDDNNDETKLKKKNNAQINPNIEQLVSYRSRSAGVAFIRLKL